MYTILLAILHTAINEIFANTSSWPRKLDHFEIKMELVEGVRLLLLTLMHSPGPLSAFN
jgi:hypothetical protein